MEFQCLQLASIRNKIWISFGLLAVLLITVGVTANNSLKANSHKYISFGSDEPQLCFRYTLVDPKGQLQPVTLYQKFVFSLSFSPENFKENLKEVDGLIDSGELEFF